MERPLLLWLGAMLVLVTLAAWIGCVATRALYQSVNRVAQRHSRIGTLTEVLSQNPKPESEAPVIAVGREP
jgi:hypothetical protein